MRKADSLYYHSGPLPNNLGTPFKSARASVQSITDSRAVRISGSNAGYTMFRGSVKSTGYPLHSPFSPSLPLPCVTVCHRISTGVYHILRIPSLLHIPPSRYLLVLQVVVGLDTSKLVAANPSDLPVCFHRPVRYADLPIEFDLKSVEY